MVPIGIGERLDSGDVDRGLVACRALESPDGQQEGLAGDDTAEGVERLLVHEQIGDPAFVFEGNEAVAFGGSRALAADGHAGYRDGAA